LIALQTDTVVLVLKAISLLHDYARQNSAAGLSCIIKRMPHIEVWEEGKPYLAIGDKL